MEAYLRFGRHAPDSGGDVTICSTNSFWPAWATRCLATSLRGRPRRPGTGLSPSAALISCSPTQQVAYDGAQQSWVLDVGEVPLAR